MVEVSHVEATGIVAHCGEDEAQWKIERAGSAAHPVRVEDPAIYESSVAVEKFAKSKFARHRLAVEKWEEEVCGEPLYIVEAVSLDIERPGEPVGGIDQS